LVERLKLASELTPRRAKLKRCGRLISPMSISSSSAHLRRAGGRRNRWTTQSMDAWLRELPAARKGSRVVVFDTRLGADTVGMGLRVLMGVIGYAAPRMARALVAKGYTSADDPQGFIVTGKEGPLATGEIDRARAWGEKLAKQFAKASMTPA
jgi:hypothetical protein